MQALKTSVMIVVGAVIGVALYLVVLTMSDQQIVNNAEIALQAERIAELEAENQELTDELFSPQEPMLPPIDPTQGPYSGGEDASDDIVIARADAKDEGRFLMVTFGANWCYDCRNLHRMLETDEVRGYTDELFDFVFVDVGKLNQNREAAERLGVDLNRGIPVAVFYSPDGALIGATNEGELESARYYSSKQILKFVRDVAERSRIAAPDAIY
jgi:thiol:disulfide interchange protein